jgi:hypothetical protein
MRQHAFIAAALALAAIAGYTAATGPVRAQSDVYPFAIGEVVTFTYPDNGSRDCKIEGIRGVFALCGSAQERTGPTYGRPTPPEIWINVMEVERVIKARADR